jgi:hypothetical protein
MVLEMASGNNPHDSKNGTTKKEISVNKSRSLFGLLDETCRAPKADGKVYVAKVEEKWTGKTDANGALFREAVFR